MSVLWKDPSMALYMQQIGDSVSLARLAPTLCSPIFSDSRARVPICYCIVGCPQAGLPVCMLTEQYRMHSTISAWPSQHFYGGRLVDADSVQGQGKAAGFHKQRCFPPLALYDCRWAAPSHTSAGAWFTCDRLPWPSAISHRPCDQPP